MTAIGSTGKSRELMNVTQPYVNVTPHLTSNSFSQDNMVLVNVVPSESLFDQLSRLQSEIYHVLSSRHLQLEFIYKRFPTPSEFAYSEQAPQKLFAYTAASVRVHFRVKSFQHYIVENVL